MCCILLPQPLQSIPTQCCQEQAQGSVLTAQGGGVPMALPWFRDPCHLSSTVFTHVFCFLGCSKSHWAKMSFP